ncbi:MULTISPECIES: hypothetical protein [unclassified Cryobacterium]|uniref:hypothetical protein n=1 Tax=unclassified Cryobacterium TaxID=2649013 RepID=UPI002AB45541|nr:MULTISPECIES: hypothetical protein [unclassified Cryobacterium]MDY7528130.1 hypothetical protein [Cryobacterium sp. 10C2]MDY7556121.1 hypothetical protein [Cryobacterium sp. 10C3]MEB0292589.1 hypothetical protein [Cryobacterium sp. 10C2]
MLIDSLRLAGMTLPGQRVDGELRLDRNHLSRLLTGRKGRVSTRVQNQILESGLEVAEFAALTPGRATVPFDGQPWLIRPIAYGEAEEHERRLRTACMVVIAYLSGMRPGEVLNLERGCVSQEGGLWVVTGRTFKSITNEFGEKMPEGEEREVPWVVVEPVAKAIQVLESLHSDQLLFPAKNFRPRDGISGRSMRSSAAAVDIGLFVAWVNEYCASSDRPDFIPRDTANPGLNLSRFRRTLAWHICRRPRGLVAAAIQYGHVFTQVTQGYGGNATSGFPDEYSFERFLARMEDLGEAERRMVEGEQVSGPAADRYRSRIATTNSTFAGLMVKTGKQAQALLNNPGLQIFQGRGMVCVFDPDRALCQLQRGLARETSTPDLTDCQSNCRNIARTDTDLEDISSRIDMLRPIVADPFAPSIRLQRERAELTRLERIQEEHQMACGRYDEPKSDLDLMKDA